MDSASSASSFVRQTAGTTPLNQKKVEWGTQTPLNQKKVEWGTQTLLNQKKVEWGTQTPLKQERLEWGTQRPVPVQEPSCLGGSSPVDHSPRS